MKEKKELTGRNDPGRRIIRDPAVRGMIRRDRSSLQSDWEYTEQLTRDNYSDR